MTFLPPPEGVPTEPIKHPYAIENNITTIIPDSGDYSLSATAIFTNGITSEISNSFVVNKALPKDIKSIDYVISSNQSQVVCHDVNIWNDATLKLEEGASLSSIDDTSKKIFNISIFLYNKYTGRTICIHKYLSIVIENVVDTVII